jgi:hypothetical protein
MADEKSHLRLVANNDLTTALQDSINQLAKVQLEEPPCEALPEPWRGKLDPEVAVAVLEAAGITVDGTEIEVEFDASAEVIDFEVQRAARRLLDNTEVSPATILKMALDDVLGPYQHCTKAYITLVLDNGKSFTTCNYRANLSRIEEVAFRQLGVTESMEGWRGHYAADEEE